MRKLALDIGQKRIGIAISDPLLVTASPLTTILRSDEKTDLTKIKELVDDNEVDEVIAGLPIELSGSVGPQAKMTQDFIEILKAELHVPVITYDERFTTHMATDLLIEADVARKKRKGLVDKMAAVFILKSYLDSLSGKEGSL